MVIYRKIITSPLTLYVGNNLEERYKVINIMDVKGRFKVQ